MLEDQRVTTQPAPLLSSDLLPPGRAAVCTDLQDVTWCLMMWLGGHGGGGLMAGDLFQP